MYLYLLLPALLLALSGCVTSPQVSDEITDESHERWYQRQQLLSTLQSWQIRGRVALFVNDDVYNLGLNWTLDQGQSKLTLEAALGQGMIELEKTGNQVTLQTSEGETFFGKNAEQVLMQSTGWSIPVEGLESWIKGINHDRSYYLPDIDNRGRAISLQQDGWHINFLQYRKSGLNKFNNPELPRKIYMKRKNLALKIVIDQWQPQQNSSSSELFPAFSD